MSKTVLKSSRLVWPLAITVAIASAGAAWAADQVKLRVAHGYSAKSVEQEVLTETAKRIRERTGGNLDISIFSDNQLGTNADVVEQAVSGGNLIVFVDASGAAQMGVPELGILSGPFLFDNTAQASKFSQSPLFTKWLDKLAKDANLRVLALNWFDQPRDIIGDKAYPKPTDLKGVKIRLPPLDAWIRTFTPLGAVPTNLTYGETYGALQQGVVNASESSVNAISAAKWPEVGKHLTRTAHMLPWLGYAMGEKAFSKLSPEHQKILLEEFNKSGEIAAERHNKRTSESLDKMKSMGVTIHDADISAYREATKAFYTTAPAWPPTLVEEVRAAAR
jgi:TRAP-type transport system periplasmic protein